MSESQSSTGSERAILREFLDYQREDLIGKLEGLTETQVRMTPTASSLSLLALVKHSGIWERRWFQIVVAGRTVREDLPEATDEESADSDPTVRLADEDNIESVIANYREQIAASNEILDSFDLDAPCVLSDMVDKNVRWVAVHMIEETARHAGHADIIRETIDGSRSS